MLRSMEIRVFQTQGQPFTWRKDGDYINNHTLAKLLPCEADENRTQTWSRNAAFFAHLVRGNEWKEAFITIPDSMLVVWLCQTLQLLTVSGRSKSQILNLTLKLLRDLESYLPFHVFSWHLSFIHSALATLLSFLSVSEARLFHASAMLLGPSPASTTLA